MLSRTDKLYIEMYKAWHRGICPNEFRKSLTSDLEFIFDMDKVNKQKQQIEDREQQIQDAMNKLQRR